MDLGGQYFNNVSASSSPVRTATALSRSAFDANVYPVIKTNCVICHQPTGNSGAAQTGQSYLRNRYVLTGDAEGDYNVTLTMVSNACNAGTVGTNALLQKPSTVPHPAGAVGQATTVQRFDGRLTSTAPMPRALPPDAVFSTVTVNIVPTESPRNWTVGATEAAAFRPTGGFGGLAASTAAATTRSATMATSAATGPLVQGVRCRASRRRPSRAAGTADRTKEPPPLSRPWSGTDLGERIDARHGPRAPGRPGRLWCLLHPESGVQMSIAPRRVWPVHGRTGHVNSLGRHPAGVSQTG